MADEIVVIYTALTCTLTFAALLFQLYGMIAADMATNTRRLQALHLRVDVVIRPFIS